MDDGMKRLLFLVLMIIFTLPMLHAKADVKEDASSTEEVTELTGRPLAKRPDIILIELRPNASEQSYKEGFSQLQKKGASIPAANLSLETFRTGGIEKMLEHAGYTILPVTEYHWSIACSKINEILNYQKLHRSMVENEVQPLCITFSAEASPEEFYSSIDPILSSDALIFFTTAPVTLAPPRPLFVVWNRYVWPNHIVEYPVALNQWIPTLAEVVGVLPPADVVEPSILPSLTGVGYQRSNDIRPKQTKANFVTLRTYILQEEQLQYTYWFPSVENMIPDSRRYLEGSLPLKSDIVATFTTLSKPQIFLVRSNLSRFSLSLPKDIAVVIKKNGLPIHSTWKTPCEWTETLPETMGFEFLFFVPAGVDPEPIKAFLTNVKGFEKTKHPPKTEMSP